MELNTPRQSNKMGGGQPPPNFIKHHDNSKRFFVRAIFGFKFSGFIYYRRVIILD